MANQVNRFDNLAQRTKVCPYCNKELTLFKNCDCPEATVKRQEWEQEYEEEKKELERKLVYAKLKRAGVGARFLDAKDENAKQLATKILEGTSLFITGGDATSLGCAIMRELALTCNKRMKFLDAQIYLQMMFKQPVETINDYGKADVLLLDGLGNGYSNSMTIPFMFQLVNARYNEDKPTIYVSVFEFDELFKKLGHNEQDKSAIEALKSRMKENTVGWRIQTENDYKDEKGA